MRGLFRILLGVLLGLLPTLGQAQPCAPTTITTQTVEIRWDDTMLEPGWSLVGYEVSRQTNQDPWQGLVFATNNRYVDAGLQGQTTYTYRVATRARDPQGTTVISTTYASHGTPPPCVTVQPVVVTPPSITNVKVFPACGPRCVTLTWESPTVETLVEIQWRLSTQSVWKALGEPVMGTSLADDQLPAKKTVCYRVREAGTEAWTAPLCTTTGGQSSATGRE